MAFRLAAGAMAFDRKPAIVVQALAKRKNPGARTGLPRPAMLMACGASKKVEVT